MPFNKGNNVNLKTAPDAVGTVTKVTKSGITVSFPTPTAGEGEFFAVESHYSLQDAEDRLERHFSRTNAFTDQDTGKRGKK